MAWYTVIGICEEQRHCFWVNAKTPAAAEKKVKRDHDTETSYTIAIAGVAEGRVKMVDEEPSPKGRPYIAPGPTKKASAR